VCFQSRRCGRAVLCRRHRDGSAKRPLQSGSARAFTSPETTALLEAIKKFEAKTGIKVELSQYAIQDMIPKTVAAPRSGTVPDVAYSDSYTCRRRAKWAFEGKLEDLGEILLPMKSAFAPNTLEPRCSITTSPRRSLLRFSG